jgi:hypothetical protein
MIMKKNRIYLAILLTAVIAISCEEVGPYINMSPPKSIDTTYISDNSETPQTKLVMIEDFTGVRCPNCPKAAQKIEDLKTQYPGRILSTAIHFDNLFGTPHSGSKDDFRTEEGKLIFTMLPGSHGSLPIGDVDRTLHIDGTGKNSVLQLYSTWPTYVSEQISKTTIVNIRIDANVVDSMCKIKVTLHYTAATSDTHALTVYFLEDSIIDLQTLPTTAIDTYYVHNHILRYVVSEYNGDDLNASLVVNRVFEKVYEFKLEPKWVMKNCSIIAFVHKKGYTFEIIQAQQKHLL